jgi:hypothetical protein
MHCSPHNQVLRRRGTVSTAVAGATPRGLAEQAQVVLVRGERADEASWAEPSEY